MPWGFIGRRGRAGDNNRAAPSHAATALLAGRCLCTAAAGRRQQSATLPAMHCRRDTDAVRGPIFRRCLSCAAAALLTVGAIPPAGCTSQDPPDDADAGPVDPSLGPADGAVIRVKSESAAAVEYRFFDRSGDDTVMGFHRIARGGASVWESEFHTGNYVHIHGREDLVLPAADQLEAMGTTPSDVLRPFDRSIEEATFDDLSLLQFDGNVMAVALWRDGVVSCVYLAGTALPAQIERAHGFDSACAWLRERCTAQNDVACADADLFPCTLAALLCDTDAHADACDQLSAWCTCGTEAVGDGNRWACAAAISHCGQGVQPEVEPSVRTLLEWIGRIIDAARHTKAARSESGAASLTPRQSP